MNKPNVSYLPFSSGKVMPNHIMVDSAGGERAVLELSHWPGNLTPTPYKADTSTESVLLFLKDNPDPSLIARFVSNDHYDIDGLLSVWALLWPGDTGQIYDELVAAATTGDFDIFVTESSVKTCLALNALEERAIQPLLNTLCWSAEDVTAFIYEHMLPMVSNCLRKPAQYQHLWDAEFREVRKSMEELEAGNAPIEEIEDIDLAVVRARDPLHIFAVNAATDATRVLTCWGGGVFQLRYRYESFVELASRTVPARVHLELLAERLNQIESSSGRWFAESVQTAHPCLQLYTEQGAPNGTGIDEDVVVEEVISYFRESIDKPENLWAPNFSWREDAEVLPPSLSSRRQKENESTFDECRKGEG